MASDALKRTAHSAVLEAERIEGYTPPYYAYGDSEAGVELASMVQQLTDLVRRLADEVYADDPAL